MFVREHLHRQLAAIDHGFGFGGEQFYQTLFEGVGGSELESLYDLLHSQVFSNPTLKQTTEYLTLLQQQQLSQYGKLFLLLKITSALKSVAMQEMLLLVPEISSLERYWQQRGRSHVSMVRYMFEQLPLQLRKPKQEWFQESLSSVFVGLRSRASVWSILDRNIQQKQKNVKNLLLGYAKQLGFLAQPSVLHHVHGKPSADTKKLANELQGWTRTKSEQVWDKILVQVYWDLLLLEHVSKGDPEDFIVEKRLLRTPSMSDLGGWIARLKQVCTLMHQIRSKAHQSLSLYQRPTLFQRYWLPVTALGLTAIVVHQTLDVNALEVAFWKLVSDGRETVFGFLREWIYKPCVDMVATIRHKEARLAIMGTESLQADLQSLERMVVDFVTDRGTREQGVIESIRNNVRNGDLTAVLSHYEDDIRNPIKSALTGDLIRSLLIQIQKAKVDGELAMSAMDKLLRSNELNFAFLAFMPTFFILYSGMGRILKLWRSSKPKGLEDLRETLLDVERVANNLNTDPNPLMHLYQGQLLCLAAHLREIRDPAKDMQRFLQDIADLEEAILIANDGQPIIAIINRMWKSYTMSSGV